MLSQHPLLALPLDAVQLVLDGLDALVFPLVTLPVKIDRPIIMGLELHLSLNLKGWSLLSRNS